ncbi:MAG: thiamine pyrophosphate-dependent enzyme [Negativicutes bacterium]|nr:thiamine pyrophosphate-dependent enzyme [Negativicutes bacterium]
MEAAKKIDFLAPGHRACPGCGAAVAVKMIGRALDSDTIVVSATGCLETFTATYEQSAWQVPWMHSLFENSAAVASGVEAALKHLGSKTRVVVISGDGGTFDIGLGALSGMFERGHDILYICYDNEAYMNTGAQRSGATTLAAHTTTTPVGTLSTGKGERKKNMAAIALAHELDYVATASIAYPKDLMNKVQKAITIPGPKYIQVHSPCCIGWGFEPSETIEVARLAVQTGLVPLYEIENGECGQVVKLPKKRPVQDYLSTQTRFKHLKSQEMQQLVNELQKYCDDNVAHFGL